MSYDWNDAAADQYYADLYAEQLYEEHKREALEEFTSERLRSYFVANPNLAVPALRALREAEALLGEHATAAQVLATIAVEVGLKVALLRPVVYGLVHQETVAAMITDLTLGHIGLDRFSKLAFQLLRDHGGVDLQTFKRDGASKSLWEEIREIQNNRNAIVHRAGQATQAQAAQALGVGKAVLGSLLPTVAGTLGLHLHESGEVVRERVCSCDKQ